MTSRPHQYRYGPDPYASATYVMLAETGRICAGISAIDADDADDQVDRAGAP